MATSTTAFNSFDTLKRADNLALIFQEVLTVIARLRVNRQRLADPDVFRSQIKNALVSAGTQGARRGYAQEDMRIGLLAVVAFLDESIVNSQNPIFANWQRNPMQQEMFGIHNAGEIFFKNLESLLARPDSEPLADLLELHQICLLLGFRGSHSAAAISGFLSPLDDKIRRIRGPLLPLAWQPPLHAIQPTGDRWVPKLKWAAIACVALALLSFAFYKVSLKSSVGQLTLASQIGK